MKDRLHCKLQSVMYGEPEPSVLDCQSPHRAILCKTAEHLLCVMPVGLTPLRAYKLAPITS